MGSLTYLKKKYWKYIWRFFPLAVKLQNKNITLFSS